MLPPLASAQDPRDYVGGGLALSPWRPESISSGASLSFANASDQTWTPALLFEVGAALGRRVSVGVELALPARRDVDQTYSYYPFAYRAEIRYREITTFGLLRFHPPGDGLLGVVLVAGDGLVRQHGLERRAERLGFTFDFGQFGPEDERSRTTWGATAGADLVLPLNPRLSLVPQVRALVVDRGETYDGDEFADLGLPKLSFRLALTLRAQFWERVTAPAPRQRARVACVPAYARATGRRRDSSTRRTALSKRSCSGLRVSAGTGPSRSHADCALRSS